jgi:hypothetical protein
MRGTTDVRTVADGVLIGGTGHGAWAAFIDWEGRPYWEAAFDMHHAIRPFRTENELLFLSLITDCEGHDGVRSDVVRIWDRAENAVTWEWRLCDHYTPPVIAPEWAHTNAIIAFPDEDSLILSSRNQDKLFKIDFRSGDLVWEMGRGGDFTFDDDDRFVHQHSPELQPNGNILLFDNGARGDREWSRAIEIEYDVDGMTYEVVWEYRPDPDFFTPVYSDADRLPNGNTLVTFGAISRTARSHMTEVNADAEEVWEIWLPLLFSIYRAERVVDVPYGYVTATRSAE